MSTFEFIQAVLPSLLALAQDLFALHNGDHAAAVREIEDRRADIQARRAGVDAALRQKHHTP